MLAQTEAPLGAALQGPDSVFDRLASHRRYQRLRTGVDLLLGVTVHKSLDVFTDLGSRAIYRDGLPEHIRELRISTYPGYSPGHEHVGWLALRESTSTSFPYEGDAITVFANEPQPLLWWLEIHKEWPAPDDLKAGGMRVEPTAPANIRRSLNVLRDLTDYIREGHQPDLVITSEEMNLARVG